MSDIKRIREITAELEELSSMNATEVAEWAMKYLKSVAEDYGSDGKTALELLSTVARLLEI